MQIPSGVQSQTFGALLKYWRGQRGWSQLELACQSEVSQRHISFMMQLMIHPQGLRPYVEDWETVAVTLLQRLQQEGQSEGPASSTARLLQALKGELHDYHLSVPPPQPPAVRCRCCPLRLSKLTSNSAFLP
jgi:redox-regulated HSP33 family molecular chaperone